MYWVLLAFSYDAFIIRMLCNGFEIWERVKHIVPEKSMSIIDTNYFFSGDFQGQEGVPIMHQCALCNPKYGIYLYIYFFFFKVNNMKY
jgi:hypothetical protein